MDISTNLITVGDIPTVIDMSHACNMTPVFIGESGIGKTEQIRKYAGMKQWYLEELNCSSLFPEDFGAIRDNDGYVQFMLNKIFDVDEKTNTIFFVDEFSRSRGDLRNILMGLINERKVYGIKISSTIKFVVAMNPATEDYADTEDPFADLATVRRYTTNKVLTSPEDWIRWAKKNKIGTPTIEYIRRNPTNLLSLQACPRQWVKIDSLHQQFGIPGIQKLGKGCIGDLVRPFLEFLQKKKLIVAKDIMTKYSTVRKEVKKDKNLQLALGLGLRDEKLMAKHKKNIIMFCLDIAEEIRYKIIMDLADSGNEKNIMKWIGENSKLSNFMEEQSNY